jgi:hypothetical protein
MIRGEKKKLSDKMMSAINNTVQQFFLISHIIIIKKWNIYYVRIKSIIINFRMYHNFIKVSNSIIHFFFVHQCQFIWKLHKNLVFVGTPIPC